MLSRSGAASDSSSSQASGIATGAPGRARGEYDAIAVASRVLRTQSTKILPSRRAFDIMRGELRRRRAHELERDAVREVAHLVPARAPRERHHHVHALSARDARERDEAERPRGRRAAPRAASTTRCHGTAVVGVEIEDSRSGRSRRSARAPQTWNSSTPICTSEISDCEVRHHRVGLLVAAHAHARHGFGNALVGVLLVEALAVDALRTAHAA